jgi:hypothetical protein
MKSFDVPERNTVHQVYPAEYSCKRRDKDVPEVPQQPGNQQQNILVHEDQAEYLCGGALVGVFEILDINQVQYHQGEIHRIEKNRDCCLIILALDKAAGQQIQDDETQVAEDNRRKVKPCAKKEDLEQIEKWLAGKGILVEQVEQNAAYTIDGDNNEQPVQQIGHMFEI